LTTVLACGPSTLSFSATASLTSSPTASDPKPSPATLFL